jgi:hypothetical protein
MVNEVLVREGYAQVASYPPDVKYLDRFLKAQREAREEGRGLWKACLGAVTPTPTPAAGATPAPGPRVVIRCIFYDGLVPRTEADEYVEIQNVGDAPQSLEGWVLKDVSEGYPSFTFPDFDLEPGQTVRVYTNEMHPEWGGFSFGSPRAIWSNSDPDTAALFDRRGTEVSRMSYPPGCQ